MEEARASGMLLRPAFLWPECLVLCAWCGDRKDHGTSLPSRSPPPVRRDRPRSSVRFSIPLAHFFPHVSPPSLVKKASLWIMIKFMTETLTGAEIGRACGRSQHTLCYCETHTRRTLCLQQSFRVVTAPPPIKGVSCFFLFLFLHVTLHGYMYWIVIFSFLKINPFSLVTEYLVQQ